jgi:hypothetical protein
MSNKLKLILLSVVIFCLIGLIITPCADVAHVSC